VFLSVRSSAFEPAVSGHRPNGVCLAAANKRSAAPGSLFALTLPKAGEYRGRLIDGD
jgi:hypothetical protein